MILRIPDLYPDQPDDDTDDEAESRYIEYTDMIQDRLIDEADL